MPTRQPSIPDRPFVMHMSWQRLLFMHWPLPPKALQPLLPRGVELETFEGQAWLGVVPFLMRNVRPRLVPPIPGLSAFPELNVRTYVHTPGGKPGVWFFSLDTTSRLSVWGARWSFRLPYYLARMQVETAGSVVHYASRRVHREAPPATFRARYWPTGEVFHAAEGTLDNWLTARWCLYSVDSQGRIYRGDIAHQPWPLQPARVEVQENTMSAQLGVALPDQQPLLHYAQRVDVRAWAPERVA